MKRLSLIIILGISLMSTSCIHIIEELFLAKNGSGRYEVTVDMSGIMVDGGLRNLGQMLNGMGGEEGGSMPDINLDEMGPIEMDSMIYFKNAPAEFADMLEDKKAFENASVRIKMSKAEEKAFFTLAVDFEDIKEIESLFKQLNSLAEDNPMASGMMGGENPFQRTKYFNASKKTIERLPTPGLSKELLENEQMAMLKMFLTAGTYKMIYHLPGKVKTVSDSRAIINGKDVELSYPLMDWLGGEVKETGHTIKFKRR